MSNELENILPDTPTLDKARLTDEALRQPLHSIQLAPPTNIFPSAPLGLVIRLMRERGASAVLICDPSTEVLLGIFTERDLVRVTQGGMDLHETPIRTLMTPNPIFLGPWDSLGFALKKMTLEGYQHLPIVDLDVHPGWSRQGNS